MVATLNVLSVVLRLSKMLRRALLPVRSSQLMTVRHARKPMWLPMAPSKLFKIPPRPVIPQSDREELAKLFNIYRTHVRAIRRYLRDEQIAIKSSLANIHSEKSKIETEREWEKCFALNDEWNKEIAAEREIYLEQKAKEREETILAKIIKADKEMEDKKKFAEEQIRIQSELSKTFITRDTLEEALEKCFKTEADYNFAIDLEGNFYHGRETNPKNVIMDTFE